MSFKFKYINFLLFLSFFLLINSQSSDPSFLLSSVCPCDFSPGTCDDFCCCDPDCPSDAINHWKGHLKCLNKNDITEMSSDRCIDSNLIIFFNKARGLDNIDVTEDIKGKEKETINNTCFSIDNSKSMKINMKSLSNLDKLGLDYETTKEKLFTQYIDVEMLSSFKGKPKTDESSPFYTNYTDTAFIKDNGFTLYSGKTCNLDKKVSLWTQESYSCEMTELQNREIFNKQVFINETQCVDTNIYYVNNTTGIIKHTRLNEIEDYYYNITSKDGDHIEYTEYSAFNIKPFNYSKEEHNILEAEFLIQIIVEGPRIDILNCTINKVITNNTKNNNEIVKFKNSVTFIDVNKYNYSDVRDLPYKYSGRGGYIVNYPIKTYLELFDGYNKLVPSEFYIVGRNKNGSCRSLEYGEAVFDYLYGEDQPLLFGKDYTYYCTRSISMNMTDSLLYQKINYIKKIGKYGSSYYGNIDNNQEWINVDFNESIDDEIDDSLINMNIYVETKGNIEYPQKAIYKVKVNYTNLKKSLTGDIIFNVKYYYLGLEGKRKDPFAEEVSYPTIMPRIPPDIAQPLIQAFVEK